MSCFIKGCKTNRNKAGNKLSLFRPSKGQLSAWKLAIPQSDKLIKRHAVCELHFKEQDIERYFIQTDMKDDSTYTLLRERPRLKKNAVPCMLLNLRESNQNLQGFRENNSNPEHVESCSRSVQNVTESIKENSVENTTDVTDNDVIEEQLHTQPLDVVNDTQSDTLDASNTEENELARLTEFLHICDVVINNPEQIPLPGNWVPQVISIDLKCIMWTEYRKGYSAVSKRIVLFSDMSLKIFIEEALINMEHVPVIQTAEDIAQLINHVSTNVFACQKIDAVNKSAKCYGYIYHDSSKPGKRKVRCSECAKDHKTFKNRLDLKKKLQNWKATHNKVVLKIKNINRKSNRLKLKVDRLKRQMIDIKAKCAKSNKEKVQEACDKLPESQRAAVQACLNASQVKDRRGNRYTNQWIYQCLLLRIKSRKTYTHLKSHEILALPCIETLNRYIRVIKGSYGFDNNVFKVLKEKTAIMNPTDVRGMLLVDEMKLTKTLAFNKEKLQMEGFTDLGKFTPEHQKKLKGDHALVIMFQPFKGKWVQTLGCFLSSGSANGTVLHQILLEAIILAERAGLKIDGVACDGASWNRSMWDIFGVTEDKVSVEHPVDPQRNLWMFSDFPHLIKCLRNFFTKQNKYDKIWTPDGDVSLKHWYAILATEDPKAYNLKINYNLREEHLNPQYYQKMNVALAFQFFGAADAMELMKDKHADLNDSEGSVKFCRRVKSLITAMNSRDYDNHLKPGNEMWKSITSFVEFLRKWEKEAKDQKNKYEFITNSTCYGLKVSLQAALEICEFLVGECGFEYLMTARLNQDYLERFFGMMRHCCGSNDHPDSSLFIQMYKLVSTYSLVKPAKGSNIAGSDVVQVLLNIKDIKNVDERKNHWDAQIDTILDKGRNCDALSDAALILEEHDYFKCTTSDYVIAYIAGFVVRKCSRFTRHKIENKTVVCQDCFSTLVLGKDEEVPESYKLISMRSKGYLYEPSIALFQLISLMEKSTLKVIEKNDISSETLFRITEALENLTPLPMLGCEEHKLFLTHNIVRFYLTTRMFFITKQVNKNENIEKERTREKRKLSKLVTGTNQVIKEKVPRKKKENVEKEKKEKVEKKKTTQNSIRPKNTSKASANVTRKRKISTTTAAIKKKRISLKDVTNVSASSSVAPPFENGIYFDCIAANNTLITNTQDLLLLQKK